MSQENLQGVSLDDLLSRRRAIDREIVARGYVRTAGSLEGELMERAVADAYDGELAAPTNKSVDAISSDGRTIQVKVRSLPPGQTRFWQFSDFDFDLTVVIWLDRLTGEIVFARELSSHEARQVAVPHASGGWRIRMAKARSAGSDVTQRIRDSYLSLR